MTRDSDRAEQLLNAFNKLKPDEKERLIKSVAPPWFSRILWSLGFKKLSVEVDLMNNK